MDGFERLLLEKWQQFYKIDIEFHPKVTIITGANGSGKSTLLRLLAKWVGWDFNLLKTPKVYEGTVRNLINLFERKFSQRIEFGEVKIGGRICKLFTINSQDFNQISYQIQIDFIQKINGLYIPSDRPEFRYFGISNLPLHLANNENIFNQTINDYRSTTLGGNSNLSIKTIKENLIRLAVFGYGNEIIERNVEAVNLFENFQAILKTILPGDIGFEGFKIRGPSEIILNTQSGEFLLDAVSGGISSLITLCWQIFLCSSSDKTKNFTVIIDEPENHLHPGMQRSLLPNLTEAFPNASFIIATHSPLIIGSVKDSKTYVLKNTGEKNEIISLELDIKKKSGSANDLLREVLGVPISIPIWAEEELDKIIKKYSETPLNEENYSKLKNELKQFDLDIWFPETLKNVVSQIDQKGKINKT